MTSHPYSSLWGLPQTRLGWWAVGLLLVFTIMNIVNAAVFMRLPAEVSWRQTLLPFYGIFMLLFGLASGITGLTALIRKQERSWLVWLAVLRGAFVVFLLLGEFLIPH